MNLAQLIDAEWAREGSRPRHALARRPDTAVELRPPVEHEMPNRPAPPARPAEIDPLRRSKVLIEGLRAVEALTKQPGTRARVAEISKALDRDTGNVSGQVAYWFRQKYLMRTGVCRQYRYELTQRGREYLKAHADG